MHLNGILAGKVLKLNLRTISQRGQIADLVLPKPQQLVKLHQEVEKIQFQGKNMIEVCKGRKLKQCKAITILS